ncbi:FHA domain-containing protein [Imhoffiella purpurea]|uniref:General secretion pathway protein A n=1 Tax=Imhoffiella purpurea TaxID=1249627 RepID=W9VC35_9GAMM|nr:FHA domain-containing protein [Imhoffiella purpurea]EXJ14536.1 General secretion pathway protein A [Imhoffiella purpurea]
MASATSSSQTELSTQARIATIGKLNYLDFFGLATPPFRNTSGIADLFLNGQLSAAQSRLDSVLNGREGGIIVMNGAPGSGKTTLANHVADRRKDRDRVAKINRTLLAEDEFLQILLHAFDIPSENLTPKQSLERFDTFLRKRERQKKRVILVIDEAQNLKPGVLDMLPHLLRAEDDNRPALFIILIGQDAFEHTLVMHGSRQLKEMILYQTYLTKLNSGDTAGYIQHQLNAAGLTQENPLSERAMLRIHQLTGGSMRLINTLCDFVLFNASMGRIRRITPDLVQTTFNALQWEPSSDGQTDKDASKPATADNQPRLVLEFRDNTPFPLDKESVTIGRATDNDICIRDLRISRHHARLTTSRQGISVEDLESTNGVYVNRVRIKVRLLQDGDLIALDEHRMRFLNPQGTRG